MTGELPGMEPPAAPKSELRTAVEETLADLREQRLLKPHHAAIAQSARSMADAVDAGVATRKASAAAMAMAQLLAALDRLPQPAAAEIGETWDERARRLLGIDA